MNKPLHDAAAAQAVVWIASYPKSGNTWVQTVVRLAGRRHDFPARDLDVYKLMADKRRPDVVRGVRKDVSATHTTVLKTHSRFTPERELHAQLRLTTAGFVYVMRNPLDLLLSYVNFTRVQYEKNQDSADYQRALFVELLGFERAIPYEQWLQCKLEDIPRANLDHALRRFTELGTVVPGIRMTGGSWLEHCFSWLEAGKRLPCVVLRYEDLLAGAEQFAPLKRLFAFTDAEIADAVAVVNERQRSQLSKKVFYNKMSAYYYPQFFSPGVISAFLTRFESELRQLGYADLPTTV